LNNNLCQNQVSSSPTFQQRGQFHLQQQQSLEEHWPLNAKEVMARVQLQGRVQHQGRLQHKGRVHDKDMILSDSFDPLS
jgi:hypothetical protein